MGMTKAQKEDYNRQKKEGADKATLQDLQKTFKQERIAENNQLNQLKSAQNAELFSIKKNLKDLGYSNAEINAALKAEKIANKTEYSDKKSTLQNDLGIGWIGYESPEGQKGPVLSAASTYQDKPDLLKSVGQDFGNTLTAYQELGVPIYTKQGDANIGVGYKSMMQALDKRNPETGDFANKGIGKFFNKIQSYQGQNLTAEQIMGKPGKNLTQDKSNPDLYYRKGGDNYYYFKKNEDGTFSNVGANRVTIDEQTGLFGGTGFLGLGDVLGPIAQVGLSIWNPAVGAAANAYNVYDYGGDLGDALKAGALSYAGSKFLPDVISKGLGSDVAVSTFGTNLAKIPGVVPGLSQAAVGALSGQSLEDALKSGLIGGTAVNVGSNVASATGSPLSGKIASGVTGGALSGMSPEQIAISTGMNVGGDYLGDLAKSYYSQNISPSVQSGINTAVGATGAPAGVQDVFKDPKFQQFVTESGKALLRQKMSSGQRPNPVMPSFASNTVLRRIGSNPEQVATGKRGGRVRVDVSKLIPLNGGVMQRHSR